MRHRGARLTDTPLPAAALWPEFLTHTLLWITVLQVSSVLKVDRTGRPAPPARHITDRGPRLSQSRGPQYEYTQCRLNKQTTRGILCQFAYQVLLPINKLKPVTLNKRKQKARQVFNLLFEINSVFALDRPSRWLLTMILMNVNNIEL